MRLLAAFALAVALCLATPALAWLPHGTAGSGCTSGPCTVQLPLSTPSIVKPPISSVVLVHSGGNPQTALNAATPGTAIIFDAGATFTGAYTLPNTSCGGGWITLESSGSSALTPGVRVAPAQVAHMATISVPGGSQNGIYANNNACKYWIDGIEVYEPGSATVSAALVQLGDDGITSPSLWPSNLILDRSYIHGSTTLDAKRGVDFEGANSAVINSYISDIHSAGNDSQAIWCNNGSGPYLVQNNYLEAAGENTMCGGGDPAITNNIPSDYTLQNNYYYKDPAWLGVWDQKNLAEMKVGNRILSQWNTLVNSPAANQVGAAYLIKTVNQSGGCNGCETSNYTIQYNTIINAEECFVIASTDIESGGTGIAVNGLNIHDNLCYDASGDGTANLWAMGNGTPSVSNDGLSNVWIYNNTTIATAGVTQTAEFLSLSSNTPAPVYFLNWHFYNNIYDTMGFDAAYSGSHASEYNGNAITLVTSGDALGTFTGNVDIGGPYGGGPSLYSAWPGNNFPATLTFVDPTNGDYRVAGGLYPGIGSQVIASQNPNCTSTSGIRSQYLGQPVLIFTANDTLVCTNGFSGHVMLVGGGAGGGCLPGGAGVYSDNPSVSISSGSTAVTVGAGGTAGNCSTSTAGGAGGSSSFNGLSAAGGAYNGGGTAASNQITGTPVNYGCPGGSTPGSACSADVGTLNSTAAAALNPQAGTGDGAGDTTASFTGTAGAVGTVIITCADERTC